jgi:hypothetical protein
MNSSQSALLDKDVKVFVWCIAAAVKIVASCGRVAAADLGAVMLALSDDKCSCNRISFQLCRLCKVIPGDVSQAWDRSRQ